MIDFGRSRVTRTRRQNKRIDVAGQSAFFEIKQKTQQFNTFNILKTIKVCLLSIIQQT